MNRDPVEPGSTPLDSNGRQSNQQTNFNAMAELQAQLDQARADLSRVQIESDSELSASNARIAELESKIGQETQLRSRLEDLQQENKQLQDSLKSRVGSDNDFNKQIETAQGEKRGLLELIRDKEVENGDLEAELKSKSEQLLSSKATIRDLESKLLSAREAERSIRLQAQSTQSEVTLSRSDRDFYAKELEKTREESQAYRAQANQQISSLQNEVDKLNHNHQSALSSLESLRVQYADLQRDHSDALEKIKSLTEQSIEAEASFQKEIEAQKRVTELMDKRDKQRAKRMEQYEQEWNVRRAELDQREKEMNEILDNERRRIAELEQKLDDTTSALSRVCGSENETNGRWEDSEFTRNSSFMSLAPDTPLAGRQNVAVFTNGLSPAAAMASKIQKSGKSLTEIYTEKIVLEEQMKKVKLENVRLSETMSQILAEIEDRAPLLHQQRLEHDRLERECDELTTQLTSSIEEKEEAERKYHSCQLDLDATRRDLELSNSQLRDLSLQIRVLTQENVLRGSGNSSQTIKGDEDDLMADVSDWRQPLDGDDEDVLIANDLITFKSIAELQQKNLKLLFLARKLTSKIQEIEENKDDEDEDQDEATSKAIDEAHELILKLKSQLQSSQHKCEALSRERDMLRRLANQRGDHHIEASSTQLEEGLRIGSQQSVEDLDAQFKAYRVEMGVDTKKLNEDLNRSRAELSQTQVLLAKSNAQIEYLNERHKALGQTNSMHAQEMQSLTASNVKLQEHIAKNETLLHQANESVIEMKNKCHFLQHQVETLTMEREVWKGVEGRLTAENSSLTRERNNINDILRNVQSMQGDIERTNLESRRRLESQINKMEIQIQDFKEKIKVESEAARQSNLQREIAVADYQQKLDKLTNEHLLSRENLSAASVAKEHLEAQVSDLQKQVAIKEERLKVYEGHRRPAALDNGIEVNLAADPSQSGEQRLQIEVADLKIELMAAKEDASRAKEHIEQFKAISQSAEAALASLTATHDEYKSAQEAELNQKQNALSSLEEHLKRLTQDLSAATTQNSELHRQIESQRAEFEKEKSSLMSRLKELEEVEEAVKTREAELREEVNQHFRSAQESHDRYQAEVQNHAKSLFELKTVKEELEKAQEKITVAQSAAELATTKLNSSQSSWSDQKVVFQREITNVQARCDDLVKQNNLLHEHLETMSAQAAKISNQAIDSIAGSTCSGGEIGVQNDFNENATESIEQLRGVIHYLRNNHDIAQHQIELSKLEVTRLQQQLQHVSKALDQTRVELNHEREKSRQGYVSSAEHSQLLDQINTLNMVRESNVTLREEAQRSERKAKQLEDRLKEMAETLEPLKKELSELKLTVQHYKQEIAILNEDNERWKARNQMILEKYDRIDPAEVQGLRDEITKLKQDLTQTKEELTSTHHFREKFKLIQTQARSQRQKHTDEISALNEELSKVKETMRDKEKDAQNSQDQANIAAAEATLRAQESLEALRKEKNELEAKLSEALSSQSKVTEVQAMLDSLKAEFEESKANHAGREIYFSKLMSDNKSFIAANRNLTAELSELKAKPPQQTAALLSEEVIEAEVTKRLQEKLSSEVDKENVSNSKEVTEKLLEEKLRETREKADAERQEAIKNAILETTERLKEEYSKSQAEAIEKIKAETISAQGDSKAISEDLIASQVAARVSEIKGELEAAASAKEKEMISKHENELREAEAAANSQASAAETGRPSPEEVQATVRAAVEEAVKARETELKEVNRVALEAAIETAKTKVAAEMNSKVNVVQMQLKRAYAQIAELKKGMTTAQPLPTSSSSAATTLPPNSATNNIPSTSATTNPPSSSTSTTLSTNGPVSMPLAQAPPQATITSANATPNTLATPAIVEPPQRTNAHNTGQNAIAPNQSAIGSVGGNWRGSIRGARGGAPNRSIPVFGNNPNRKPPTENQVGKQTASSGPPPAAASSGSMVTIRGAASKGVAIGSSNLLGAAMRAAGNFSVGENANSIGTGLVVTPVPAPVSAKRGREDEGVMNLTNGEQSGDGMKRAKGASNGNETGGLSKTSSELASRLSKRD